MSALVVVAALVWTLTGLADDGEVSNDPDHEHPPAGSSEAP